jgi:hypothetical protein
MKKIREYKFLKVSDSLDCAEPDINSFIEKGWQPYGGPFVYRTSWIIQAVVRYEE